MSRGELCVAVVALALLSVWLLVPAGHAPAARPGKCPPWWPQAQWIYERPMVPGDEKGWQFVCWFRPLRGNLTARGTL